MKKLRSTWSALALSGLMISPLCADVPAYSFTNGATSSDSQLSLGFVFSTNKSVTVNALGYYDYLGEGFVTAHIVGIFDSVGNLLTSTTLAAGTTDPLIGQFRYRSITPFVLGGGSTFELAATTGGSADLWAYGTEGTSTLADLVTDPALDIPAQAARFYYQGDDVLRYATNQYGDYTLYAGPNFLVSATPEPGSYGLMGLGLSGLFVAVRQRFN